MAVPALLKSPYMMGGLGVVGTPSLAYGGWCIYDSSIPASHKDLSKRGYSWNPLPKKPKDSKPQALDVVKTSDLPFEFELGGCFKRFFPGAEVKFDDRISENRQGTYSALAPSSYSPKFSPIGCSTMSLFNTTDETKFSFMSETTVKNDRVGIAVWAGAKNARFSQGTVTGEYALSKALQLYYVVVVLEKSGNRWTVKNGAQWKDQTSTFAVAGTAAELKIISPDSKLNATYKVAKDDTEVQITESSHYSGIWEQSNETGSEEVFKEICVAFRPWSTSEHQSDEEGCKSVNPEILGRSGDFSAANSSSPSQKNGYSNVDYVYDVSSQKWIHQSTGQYHDFTSTLNTWYGPFKDKKGKWRSDVADYCKSVSKNKNADEETLYLLEGFCYMRNSPPR